MHEEAICPSRKVAPPDELVGHVWLSLANKNILWWNGIEESGAHEF